MPRAAPRSAPSVLEPRPESAATARSTIASASGRWSMSAGPVVLGSMHCSPPTSTLDGAAIRFSQRALLADVIGHERAAQPERPIATDRRVLRGLVLDLGVELRAQQDHERGPE